MCGAGEICVCICVFMVRENEGKATKIHPKTSDQISHVHSNGNTHPCLRTPLQLH